MATNPIPITINGGIIYVDGHDMGNILKATFYPKVEYVTYNDYSLGVRTPGRREIKSLNYTGQFTTDYITSANLDYYTQFNSSSGELGLYKLEFVSVSFTGLNVNYTFEKVILYPSQETELAGDKAFQELVFTFEGVFDNESYKVPVDINYGAVTPVTTTTT